MGRSGGGHHGGGRGSYSHTRRSRRHGSKGKNVKLSLSENFLFTGIFILVVIIIVAIILAVDLSNGTPSYDYELSPKEQYLWCSGRKTKIEYSSEDVAAYESVNGTPAIGNETRMKRATLSGHLSNSYKYQSFFMPPGSYLSAYKTSTSAITNFVLIRGWSNMEKFMDDESYNDYIQKSSADDLEFTSTRFDEYFVVIDSKRSTDYTVEINVTLTTYDTEGLVEQCTGDSSSCTLNKEGNSNFCVVLDYDVANDDSYPNVKISFNDGTGSKIGSGTIAAIVIGGICVLAGIGVMVEGIIDHLISSAYSDPNKDTDISDIFTEDPEIEMNPSEVDEKASYPVASPSDIPSAVDPYPTANPNYDASYPTAPPPQ